MKKPKIMVIMATYNGEKYIREQIDSILKQEDVDLILHIFDDVSKDGTINIVNEYQQKYSNIKLTINERNKNYAYNFLDGLFTYKNSKEYDYYAFSDQDDVWLPKKLITAIDTIKRVGKCTLYSSNSNVVDKDLNPIGRTNFEQSYKYFHHDQIFNSHATGCTEVMDNDFKNLVVRHYPKNFTMPHDYWLGLIANYCKGANFYYDNNYYILYRQHGNNLSGSSVKKNIFSRLIGLIFSGVKLYFSDLKFFIENFTDEINEKDKEIIEKFIDYKKNKRFLIKNLQCFNPKRIKLKLLLNRYKE